MPRLRRKGFLAVIIFLVFIINIIFLGPKVRAVDNNEDSVNVIQQEESKNKKDENLTKFILLVTIDGLGEQSVLKGNTPNINGLAGSGVKTKAVSVFPATSQSAIASIITGTLPETHKFTHSGAKTELISLPDQIAGKQQSAVVVDGNDGITKGLIKKARFLADNKGDKSTTDLAIKEFENKKPYFMHVVLSGVNKANQKYGSDSPEHFKAVEEADKQVGRLLGKLHEYGLFQYSIVVVSGSYGVTDSSLNKYNSSDEVLVPLFMKGPTIDTGITVPVASLTNIAPTIAYILGMKNDKQENQVLWDILKNEGGNSEAYLLKKRVKDIGEQLGETARREYKLSYEQMEINHEKSSLQQERSQVQSIINSKNKEIKKGKLKLTLFKTVALIAVIIFGLGYLYEYRFLKRKFLMFR